jgi:hypothetical protein
MVVRHPQAPLTLLGVNKAGCSGLILMEVPSSASRRGTAGAGKNDLRRGGDLRRFSPTPHQVYGGIDLPARTLDLGLLHQDGEIMLHHTMKTAPEPFRKASTARRKFNFGLSGQRTSSVGPFERFGHGFVEILNKG